MTAGEGLLGRSLRNLCWDYPIIRLGGTGVIDYCTSFPDPTNSFIYYDGGSDAPFLEKYPADRKNIPTGCNRELRSSSTDDHSMDTLLGCLHI